MAQRIVIVGGGPGGVAAAIRSRQLGAEAVLVEPDHLGGVCMNSGCIPIRILGTCVEAAWTAADAERMGLRPMEFQMDPERLERRIEQTVQYMRMGTRSLLKARAVEVLSGKARLTGDGRVQVNGKALKADAVVLAMGADWARPGFPGADLPGVGPPEPHFDVVGPHRRILLAGGSDWTVELAAFYARFGRETALVEPEEFLPRFDRQISVRLRNELKKGGVDVLRHAAIEGVEKTSKGLRALLRVKGGEEKREFDRVIFTDRVPRTSGMGLEAAGVALAEGAVSVDETLRTSLPHVYAIGDVTGPPYSSHKASAQGELAAENALGARRSFAERVVPAVLYTRPEAAAVGLTEKGAKARHGKVLVGEVPYGFNARAMAEMKEGGVVRALFDEKYLQLLGVHVLGPHSAELITQAALALQLEATAQELVDVIAPHPTYAEALADAARMAMGRALYVPA